MFVVNIPDRSSMVVKSFASSWRYNITATSNPARLNVSVIDVKIIVQRQVFLSSKTLQYGAQCGGWEFYKTAVSAANSVSQK